MIGTSTKTEETEYRVTHVCEVQNGKQVNLTEIEYTVSDGMPPRVFRYKIALNRKELFGFVTLLMEYVKIMDEVEDH